MFPLDTLTKKLVFINIVSFVLLFCFSIVSVDLFKIFTLYPFDDQRFHYFQFITYQFLHGGLIHLFCNMIGLWTIGKDVENFFGKEKFILYYLIMGIFAASFHLMFSDSNSSMVGASGAIFGLLAVFTLCNPDQKLSIIFIPYGIKAKYLTTFLITTEVVLQLMSTEDRISHLAHIGGFITGVILYYHHSVNLKS